jgi:hypothetical protein
VNDSIVQNITIADAAMVTLEGELRIGTTSGSPASSYTDPIIISGYWDAERTMQAFQSIVMPPLTAADNGLYCSGDYSGKVESQASPKALYVSVYTTRYSSSLSYDFTSALPIGSAGITGQNIEVYSWQSSSTGSSYTRSLYLQIKDDTGAVVVPKIAILKRYLYPSGQNSGQTSDGKVTLIGTQSISDYSFFNNSITWISANLSRIGAQACAGGWEFEQNQWTTGDSFGTAEQPITFDAIKLSGTTSASAVYAHIGDIKGDRIAAEVTGGSWTIYLPPFHEETTLSFRDEGGNRLGGQVTVHKTSIGNISL